MTTRNWSNEFRVIEACFIAAGKGTHRSRSGSQYYDYSDGSIVSRKSSAGSISTKSPSPIARASRQINYSGDPFKNRGHAVAKGFFFGSDFVATSRMGVSVAWKLKCTFNLDEAFRHAIEHL